MAHSPEPGRRPEASRPARGDLDQFTTHDQARFGVAMWRMLAVGSAIVVLLIIILLVYIVVFSALPWG